MIDFRRCLDSECRVPQYFPVFERNPTTWASIDHDTDEWWDTSMATELLIEDPPSRLNQARSAHVKTFGSVHSRMLVLSSYLTAGKDNSGHMDFAAASDISNACMFDVSMKFGFSEEGMFPTSICWVDYCPIRPDRKNIRGEDIMGRLPRILRDHFCERIRTLLRMSTASIIVLAGRYAQSRYEEYLDDEGIEVTVIPFLGSDPLHDLVRPSGWIEWTRSSDGARHIHRISLCIPHPGLFNRLRGYVGRPITRVMMINERLIDWAHTFLHGFPSRTAFFSTMRWFKSREGRSAFSVVYLHTLLMRESASHDVFQGSAFRDQGPPQGGSGGYLCALYQLLNAIERCSPVILGFRGARVGVQAIRSDYAAPRREKACSDSKEVELAKHERCSDVERGSSGNEQTQVC